MVHTRIAGLLTSAALLLLIIPIQAAHATTPTIGTYLIGLRHGASPSALAQAGVTVRQSWPNLKTAEVVTDQQNLNRLRTNPAVAYVEPETSIVRAASITSAVSAPLTWGLRRITAAAAWKLGTTGQGVKVCDLDSGIDYAHPDFQGGVIKGSRNFVNDGHANAKDGEGHGTFTAGEIAARLDQNGVAGAAYGVQLYVARVLNDNGEGTIGSLINGVNWCVNTVHARILNMSFGDTQSSRTVQTLFANVYSKGVLSFAASGNEATNGVDYPAAYPSVIAVGATDQSNALADFSNYGSKQELVAPGVSVLSTVPVGTGVQTSFTDNGTSIPTTSVHYSANGTISGPLIDCGLASSNTSCTGAPSSGSWIALINRGSNTFAEKVRNVMAQGAAAAVITNNDQTNPNDAGSFELADAANWIPTVSVSYNNGVKLQSAGRSTATVSVQPWNYMYADGTSASSPYAAAAAALAWSANPRLSNTQIRTILQKTAKDLGAAGKDKKFGYGLVQAKAAVQLARATKP